MVKIYAVAVSMIMTMCLSTVLFGGTLSCMSIWSVADAPTTQLFFGIIIITVSILMYFDVLIPKVDGTITFYFNIADTRELETVKVEQPNSPQQVTFIVVNLNKQEKSQ